MIKGAVITIGTGLQLAEVRDYEEQIFNLNTKL
jgi:hypothetical protein